MRAPSADFPDRSRIAEGCDTSRSQAAADTLDRVLDGYRTVHNIPDPLVYAPDGYRDEVVVVCPGFVLEDFGQPPTTQKSANLAGGPPVRSNDASAVEAYWNVKQFFDRLRAYGIRPIDYFRIAPLSTRSSLSLWRQPGPRQRRSNCQCARSREGLSGQLEGPVPEGALIELHFALADLSTRARKPWDGKKRSPAEPLGIAADTRWVWHEIGHVLLTTSVGELAVQIRPQPRRCPCRYRVGSGIEASDRPELAGLDFPWVFLPRRHDRCVSQGWSWSGGLHYGLSQVGNSAGPRRKGYWSEQILSSSLFRLYRCIGGDTTAVGLPRDPDLHARRSASHSSCYLIMRGIQILGTSLVAPTNEPDQFVSALIDADINTASITPSWHLVFRPIFPPGPIDTFDRIGGCVHKVIRWAFEAQGLYRSFTNAPGYPPPVDVYIADLRPTSESTRRVATSIMDPAATIRFHWSGIKSTCPANPPPKWQADPAAITLSPTGEISVVVGNRGTASAQAVSVSVWWKEWPAGPAPQWDAATWAQCAPIGAAIQNIPPNGGQANFGTFAAVPLQAGTRYLLLAQATCADDRANVDPATTFRAARNRHRLSIW